MPEITVVITAYNLERHLPKRFCELAAQTFQDFELLLLDDCSTDETAKLILAAEAADPRRVHAILLDQNLGSPAKTRNRAMDSGLIRGAYVLFLDGDDALEPTLLARLYDGVKETNADMAICAYDRVEEQSGRVLCREMQGFPATVEMRVAGDLPAYVNTSLWNKLIRTDLIGDVRIPDFRVGEDMTFLTRLYRKCTRLAFVDEVLMHYQVRGVSVISNTAEETVWAFAEELERQLEQSAGTEWFETLALMTFIHIGISMAMRARDNPAIILCAHLRRTKAYLKSNGLLTGRRYLRLGALLRHGVKGMGIWCCRILYKVNAMGAFLAAYSAMTKRFRVDLKF